MVKFWRGLATDSTYKLSNCVCILVCIWNDSLFLMQVTMESVESSWHWREICQLLKQSASNQNEFEFSNLQNFKVFIFFFFPHSFRVGEKMSTSWNPLRMIELFFFSFLWHPLFISAWVVSSVGWNCRQEQVVLPSVLQGQGIPWRVNQT